MPFQALVYRFAVPISPISHIFSAWMVVMDAKLFPLVYWPEREQLLLYHANVFSICICEKSHRRP